MKLPINNIDIENIIFDVSEQNFNSIALSIFNFQYKNNIVYNKYCNALKIDINKITCIKQIPFLPIQFFKYHKIISTSFVEEIYFESSGTTNSINSKHFVKSIDLYKKSFNNCFKLFYDTENIDTILGLLPSYLQKGNSSLVYMVDNLITQTNDNLSGFYLKDLQKLYNTLIINEQLKKTTILIGVTYALLDFAEKFSMNLKHTIIMETGGMKGRREELTREEVHKILKTKLGVNEIHSEYGMTELLSQAYSKGDGIFKCPPWMKIFLREQDDPLTLKDIKNGTLNATVGVVNIIDLANLYSCSFIATDDLGKLYKNDSFEILGRIDNSDIRGCSQLYM